MATKIYTHYNPSENTELESAELLNDLNFKLKQIINSLKAENPHWSLKRNFLYKKPWVLVIGPNDAGKSSLIHQANIKIKQSFQQVDQNCGSSLSEDAVYIEIPGKCISNKELIGIWPDIYKCLKLFRRHQPLDSIILNLNLQHLLQQNKLQRNAQLADIYKILRKITESTKRKLPIHVILTHADLISGFSEFFDDLNQQERQQACGFLLSNDVEPSKLLNTFQNEFSNLLQRLNNRLITRLHQVRNPAKRILIKDFPLQIESISSIFRQIIKQIFSRDENINKHFFCAGFFITSNQQVGITQNELSKQISQSFALTLPTTHAQRQQQKVYFSKQLLEKVIPSTSNLEATSFLKKNRHFIRFMHASIMLITFLGALLLANNFHKEVKAFSKAEDYIQTYQLLSHFNHQSTNYTQKNLQQTLSEINVLAQANKTLSQQGNEKLNRLFFKRIAQAERLTQTAYRHAVEKDLLPHLIIRIEKDLSENKNPSQVYSALKAYLMLGNPDQLDPNYLTNWLLKHLRNNPNVNTKKLQEAKNYLLNALAEKTPPVILNRTLIQHARDYINVLPQQFVAYLLLKHDASYSIDTTNTEDIPILYTMTGFKTIYSQQIEQICQRIILGDYILGRRIANHNLNLATLKQDVDRLYFADYRNWWELYLYNQQDITFTNFEQATGTLNNLSLKVTVLPNVLQTIRENTLPPMDHTPITTAFEANVSRHFYALNQLSPDEISSIQHNIAGLNNYLQKITASENPNKTAFNFTKKRFTQQTNFDPIGKLIYQSERLPTPLNRWLHSLAVNSWYLILNKTHNYLNQQWQETILTDYLKFIADRYPVNKLAGNDIELREFIKFFAYHGTLDNYFNNYLKPFIDTSTANWEIKKVDGLGLALDADSLQQLIRANLIRTMFFTDDTQQINVGFSLQPIAFQPIVKDFTLDLAGQKIFDYQGSSKISYLQWPGPAIGADVQLKIDNVSGEVLKSNARGPWAWFKLLDKSFVESTDDTRRYLLTFDLKGNAVKYELLSNKVINPFIPKVIDHFRLPEKIV